MNRSALRGYKDAGVKNVQWWAAKDERTCDICGVNHEKIYDVDKAPILPCHPGCRCTWLPVIDDVNKLGSGKSSGQKRPSNGEYVETIHDMKSVDKYIKKYENEIKDCDVEHSYIIQNDGRVFHYTGDKETVTFEGADLTDAIVLHNHVLIEGIKENSFADDDFWFLQNHGLEINRLRAVYGNIEYEVKVLKNLKTLRYRDYQNRGGDVMLNDLMIDGDLEEYAYRELEKDGYIKYGKAKMERQTKKDS